MKEFFRGRASPKRYPRGSKLSFPLARGRVETALRSYVSENENVIKFSRVTDKIQVAFSVTTGAFPKLRHKSHSRPGESRSSRKRDECCRDFGASRGWDKLVPFVFIPTRYLIIGEAFRRDIPLGPNRWSRSFAATPRLCSVPLMRPG